MSELMQDPIANPRHSCNIITLCDPTLLNLKPVHVLSNSETIETHATLPNLYQTQILSRDNEENEVSRSACVTGYERKIISPKI